MPYSSSDKPRPPCGTWQGYRAHQGRGEETCVECRRAWRVYLRHRAAERAKGNKVKGVGRPRRGTKIRGE